MKYILAILLMTLNFTFCLFQHPMTLSINLLLQTCIMTLLMGSMNKTFWFSYIMFLIMVGALLILFMYMTSLTPNKKFKFNYNLLMMMFFFLTTMSLLYFKTDTMPMLLKSLTEESILFMNECNNNNINKESFMMNWMYNDSEKFLTFILIIYLLFVLFIIVKIIDIKKGMMRKTMN